MSSTKKYETLRLVFMNKNQTDQNQSKGHHCRFCGRPINSIESIDRGAGLVCLKKHPSFLAKHRAISAAGQLDLFPPKYSTFHRRGVVILYDHDDGRRSLTSAMDSVVPYLYGRGILTAKRVLIYRDSNGTFDGVAHAKGRFVGFIPLGSKTRSGAINGLSRKTKARKGGAR